MLHKHGVCMTLNPAPLAILHKELFLQFTWLYILNILPDRCQKKIYNNINSKTKTSNLKLSNKRFRGFLTIHPECLPENLTFHLITNDLLI